MKAVYAIVGMQYRSRETGTDVEALVRSLPDGEPVQLIRDPENLYDRNAVQVWARGTHVGFIPTKQNAMLAMAMDHGRVGDENGVAGRFCARNAERQPLVEVDE